MDRRRSTNTNPSSSTPSLQDKDAAMGPPPPPPPSSSQRKDLTEVVEKYNKLKRRYADLEEVLFHDPFLLRVYSHPAFHRSIKRPARNCVVQAGETSG
jgi:hypothetical protein